jgi:hypothetical protein
VQLWNGTIGFPLCEFGVALTIISITHPSRSRVSNLLRPLGDGAHAVVHNLATVPMLWFTIWPWCPCCGSQSGHGAHAVVHNLATILHFDSSGCRALDSSHDLLFQWPYLSDWFVVQKQQVGGCDNSGCRANYQKNEVSTLVLTHLKKSLNLIQMKKGISPLQHTIVP